jgi:hypothetical protein
MITETTAGEPQDRNNDDKTENRGVGLLKDRPELERPARATSMTAVARRQVAAAAIGVRARVSLAG